MSKVPRYIAIKYMCEILCMSTLSRQKIKGNNDLNAMYVDTVETKRKYTKLDYICLTSLTRAKCGVRSTLCWKNPNISGSTELFAL